MSEETSKEGSRILAENLRRRREVSRDRYAPWNPVEIFMCAGRVRVAAAMLKAAGCFPRAGDACLEVGYGRLGWLAELIGWGLREADLHGIELDEERALVARQALPSADLRVGDASQLPFESGTFRLVVVSTVLTSILDRPTRRRVAEEITRVLAPGGALLWYDFARNNPRNPHVQRVTRRDLRSLFPDLAGSIRSVTLAPPLARATVPWSRPLGAALELLPFLRTHLLAVLVKPGHGQGPRSAAP